MFSEKQHEAESLRQPKGTLNVFEATESDADAIAAIHMAAFGSNALLLAQFPTSAIRDELQTCIAEKAAADIRDPKVAVLVVRDQDHIISFAKWHLPVKSSEEYSETPWRWPKGSNLAILDTWTKKVESAEESHVGDTPCYPALLGNRLAIDIGMLPP
ncbi:hypothetical protein G7Y79_00055g089650 [Physcia stellaris]|nr:hypothetical protein G7Y79_00055g089650 [Physcia stellaris]